MSKIFSRIIFTSSYLSLAHTVFANVEFTLKERRDKVVSTNNVVSTLDTDVVSTLCNVQNPTLEFVTFSTSDQRYFSVDPQRWNNVDLTLKCWLGCFILSIDKRTSILQQVVESPQKKKKEKERNRKIQNNTYHEMTPIIVLIWNKERVHVRYFQKQPQDLFCKKRCSHKFRKFHRKIPVLESLFNENIGKFLRTPILKNICERLLEILISLFSYQWMIAFSYKSTEE